MGDIQEEKKKELTKAQKWQIFISFMMFATFIADLFVCIFVDSFTIGYFFVVMLMLFIPLCHTIVFVQDIQAKGYNQDKKYSIIANYILYLFILELEGLFLLSALQEWIVPFYLSGIIVLLIRIGSVLRNFTGNYVYGKGMLLLDLVLIIVITVTLIYFIPIEYANLQIIVTSIVAAIYGGLITLSGVVLTIKHGDKQRKEDIKREKQKQEEMEKKQAKPFFTFNLVFQPPTNINGIKTCVTDLDINYDNELYAELENSNHAPFIIKRIEHDGQWFGFSANTQILQSGKVVISWLFNSFLDMYLEVEDLLGNLYYYSIKVVTFNHISEINKLCYTIRELKEVSIDEIREKKLL